MNNSTNQFMSTVKVGTKGQIVIPKEIRDMFGIKAGDSLIIMADTEKGIAIQRQDVLAQIAEAIFSGQTIQPHENQQDLATFAKEIMKITEKEE
ncbi:MAG: AbrB/MazE/SpoVT family DNA-binding domain-containing protein [Bacillus sp. (in: firmicutes)]